MCSIICFFCFTQSNPTCDKHNYVLNYCKIVESSIDHRVFNFKLDIAWKKDGCAHHGKKTDWPIICTYFTFLTFQNKITLIVRNYMFFVETVIVVLAKTSHKYRPIFGEEFDFISWRSGHYDLFTFRFVALCLYFFCPKVK